MAGFTGQYEYDPDGVNRIIDERGNQAIVLRKVRWQPDKEFKLDLRKCIFDADGEKQYKGISFLTDEGPNELVKVLLEEGYGDPDEIAKIIHTRRSDIKQAFEYFNDDEDSSVPEDLYDPREMVS